MIFKEHIIPLLKTVQLLPPDLRIKFELHLAPVYISCLVFCHPSFNVPWFSQNWVLSFGQRKHFIAPRTSSSMAYNPIVIGCLLVCLQYLTIRALGAGSPSGPLAISLSAKHSSWHHGCSVMIESICERTNSKPWGQREPPQKALNLGGEHIYIDKLISLLNQ